jgi:hypothetical protein
MGQYPAMAAETSFTDANIQVDLTHQNAVTVGGKFTVSAVLKGKTSDNVNVTLSISPSKAFLVLGNSSFYIPEIRQGSTLGFTFELQPSMDVTEGLHSVNIAVDYRHKEILGDYSQQSFSKAVEIRLGSEPDIIYSIQAPDSLFASDKFPVKVEMWNNGVDAHELAVSIIPPDDLSVAGQNVHELSKLGAGEKFIFEFDLKVPDNVEQEKKLLQIKTSYLDSSGKRHESTETFPLMIRPRGFLEIGPAGGVWVGPMFISFIVGVGSIASTVIGVMLFIYRVKQKRGEKIRRKR